MCIGEQQGEGTTGGSRIFCTLSKRVSACGTSMFCRAICTFARYAWMRAMSADIKHLLSSLRECDGENNQYVYAYYT
jgi:hypothetical protein